MQQCPSKVESYKTSAREQIIEGIGPKKYNICYSELIAHHFVDLHLKEYVFGNT